MVNKPCCIDLYQGDDVSDNPTSLAGLDRVKASGIFACIHKVSEGTGERDQRYDARREKWMSGNAVSVTDVDGSKLTLPPVWGGYHFFHGVDPTGEARNFIMTARLAPGDMAFLDWEAVGASGYQPSLEAADAFCSAVEAATGRPCGVYGGNVPRERFQAGNVSDAVLERFAARPLWFCAYGSYSPERFKELIPEPWKNSGVWLWQDDGDKSGPGPHVIPGIARYCDNSTVVGGMTFARLHSEWLGGVVTSETDVTEPLNVQPEPPTPPTPVEPPVEPPPSPEVAPEPDDKKSRLEKLQDEMKHLAQEIEQEVKRDV